MKNEQKINFFKNINYVEVGMIVSVIVAVVTLLILIYNIKWNKIRKENIINILGLVEFITLIGFAYLFYSITANENEVRYLVTFASAVLTPINFGLIYANILKKVTTNLQKIVMMVLSLAIAFPPSILLAVTVYQLACLIK
ncbi:MAG: hypothetical protein RR500_01270 [Bacilli bacterium]